MDILLAHLLQAKQTKHTELRLLIMSAIASSARTAQLHDFIRRRLRMDAKVQLLTAGGTGPVKIEWMTLAIDVRHCKSMCL